MRHAVIVLAVASCLSVFAHGQTADELVQKNIQAKGGIDKIKAIKSIRLTGKLDGGGGFSAATLQENQRPGSSIERTSGYRMAMRTTPAARLRDRRH